MLLFTRKVNCWFCQHEQRVSFLRTNSFTCTHCHQYNGFTRDGDYNRSISEMHATSPASAPAKFISTQRHSINNENILCVRCNRYQELKMLELGKFEPKDENNEEEEYRVFKLRIEETYDLCASCKKNVQSHLHQIDKQIGTQMSSFSRRTLPLKTLGNAVLNGIYKEYQYDDLKKNTKALQKPSQSISKAHTIAGTIEPHQIKNLMKKNALNSPKTEQILAKKTLQIDAQIKSKIHYLIACDFLIFITMLSIFLGDLINVLNDSQSLDLQSNSNLFLFIHHYSFYILSGIIALSMVLFVQRPKVARIFNILFILGCTWVHHDSYEAKNAEKRYIVQLLSSFFLSVFIFIARLYNIIQALTYFKPNSQEKLPQETSNAGVSPSPRASNQRRARKNNSSIQNLTPQRTINTTYNLRSATHTPQNMLKSNDTTCSPMQIDDTSFNDFKVPTTTLLKASAY